LATGGGSCDRHIHFWNTTTASRLNSVDTGSQVTSLRWSKEYKEIASTHGHPNNQISLWSYPSLSRIIDIPAHDARILHSALSPDGQVLATVASDENLKFWKIFETCAAKKSSLTDRPAESTSRSKEKPAILPKSIR
jgi:cell division cycle protein 20 (cofactor of APC complex)